MMRCLVALLVAPVARANVCQHYDGDKAACESAGCLSDGLCRWESWSNLCEGYEAGGIKCVDGVAVIIHAPTIAPSALPSPAPTHLPPTLTLAPTTGCEDGEAPYRLALYDYGEDGWEGATYSVTSGDTVVATGTLERGGEGVDGFCLLDGTYELAFGGGADDAETSVQFLPADEQLVTAMVGPASFSFVAAAGAVADADASSGGGGGGGGGESADAASAGMFAALALAVLFLGVGAWWVVRKRRKDSEEPSEDECVGFLDIRSKLRDGPQWADTQKGVELERVAEPQDQNFSAIEAALGSPTHEL